MQASGKGSFDNNWAQLTAVLPSQILSSDRSSYSDDVLLNIQPVFGILTQPINAFDVFLIFLLFLVFLLFLLYIKYKIRLSSP